MKAKTCGQPALLADAGTDPHVTIVRATDSEPHALSPLVLTTGGEGPSLSPRVEAPLPPEAAPWERHSWRDVIPWERHSWRDVIPWERHSWRDVTPPHNVALALARPALCVLWQLGVIGAGMPLPRSAIPS
jgi:hypothetical protein